MQRLRLYDVRLSELPQAIGYCQADMARIANAVNRAQRRLLLCKEAGEEGWWGTYAEIRFNLSRATPYWTAPRGIARLIACDVCSKPVPIRNQWTEYMQWGNGRMPKLWSHMDHFNPLQAYARNNAITAIDMTPGKLLAAYVTQSDDVGTRIFFQGTDANNVQVVNLDNGNTVLGYYVRGILNTPAITPFQWNSLTGIQKDITEGEVQIFEIDPTTGDQSLLLTMEPSETTASYRRYYFDNLPCSCCVPAGTTPSASSTVQVTAIAKLEMVPVSSDQDYLLIQNLEAITEEAQAIRFSQMDNSTGPAMAAAHHANAVRYLNGELTHYLGKLTPAVQFSPFGSADLRKQRIGDLV